MTSALARDAVRVVDGLSSLAPHTDVIICDVWGVLHNGLTAYPGASDALTRYRAGGGTVILVSNAPPPRGQRDRAARQARRAPHRL